jgi:plastocyanin
MVVLMRAFISIVLVMMLAVVTYAQAPSAKIIRVSAERFAYSPSEITGEKGTEIEFHLTS